MPGTTQGSTAGQRQLGQFLALGPASGDVTTHLDPKYSQGSTDGYVYLGQFLVMGPGTSEFGFHADGKYHLGVTTGWVHLPIEGGGEQIIVATWEDDIVAQLALMAVPTIRTQIYLVPAGRNAIIRFIDLINDSGNPITVSVWIAGIKIVPSKVVAANDVYYRNGIWDIHPGDIIEAQASVAGANISVSGVLELTA